MVQSKATAIRLHGSESTLATAVGRDLKGKASLVCYVLAIALAFWNAWVSMGLYVFVACIWFVPDRRIERVITE